MPQPAEMEVVNLEGREIKLRWKSSRFGEWLAWCYVPAESGMHNAGVGFEARGNSQESAKEACLDKVRRHLSAPKTAA